MLISSPAKRFLRALLFLSVLGLFGCGSDDHGESILSLARIPGQPAPDFSNLVPYEASAPYAPVLTECVKAEEIEESCTLEKLPLLGQETANPTVEDVMGRVVVSHAWMGDRFKDMLSALDPDILTLLKGVTAVVIDDDIRPSFYYGGTGAIYLDPSYLWLNNAEKATISRQPDFRSGFGAQLSFLPLWRYTLDNQNASEDFSLFGTETREKKDLTYDLAALLYHELAHANDFLPPAEIANLDGKLSIYANLLALEGVTVSDQLRGKAPLTSSLWPGLAQVLFRGARASSAQRIVDAETVGADFEKDAANEPYAYSHPAEDVSMLFEETMMNYHYGLERDLAFIPVPTVADSSCKDLVVKWGYRNRIAEAKVKERARIVAERLLPEKDLNGFFAALAPPVPLRTDVDWCTNLDPSTPTAAPGLGTMSLDNYRNLSRDMAPPHAR